MSTEKRFSKYIDSLNNGQTPKEHRSGIKDDEYRELTAFVRKLRSLREVEYPEEKYQEHLAAAANKKSQAKKRAAGFTFIRRTLIFTAVSAAAAVILFSAGNMLFHKDTNIVYAMERAMEAVKAYHGILEVSETNELGETVTQSKKEIWADNEGNYCVRDLEGFTQGMATINNGDRKWQLRPDEKVSYIFSAFPDPYRFTFEIGNEVNDVQKAQTIKTIGEDVVDGRDTVLLEVTPDGGQPYRLWVDEATDLPLKKQTAMQNAIEYQVSYSSIEFIDAIPEELLAYSLPEGYKEVNTDQEQIVTTIEEAESKAGIQAVIPDQIPEGFTLSRIAVEENKPVVKLYYSTVDKQTRIIVQEEEALQEFAPDSNAILGTVNGNQAEIIKAGETPSIRWQENGMEYSVLGNTPIETISDFSEELSGGKVIIPQSEEVQDGEAQNEETAVNKPQIEVPYDLSVEENDQKSVDEGHSPWRLDPVFVTQVFASLLLSPEGIVGDYPIPYDDIKIIENNGSEAKAEIKNEKSIAKYVYLKRLIRQDDTGIWTVVGYDTSEQK